MLKFQSLTNQNVSGTITALRQYKKNRYGIYLGQSWDKGLNLIEEFIDPTEAIKRYYELILN